jgi:predicted ester cyclase
MTSTDRQLSHLLSVVVLLSAAILFAIPTASHADTDSDLVRKALVQQFYQEFDAGHLEEFAAISPDFAAEVMGNMVLDWRGFLDFGGQFLDAFPDGRHVFDHILVDGEWVFTVGTYHGTHRGTLMGIAPTNLPVALKVMHLDRIENGRIVEHRGIGNALDLLQQLEALPE